MWIVAIIGIVVLFAAGGGGGSSTVDCASVKHRFADASSIPIVVEWAKAWQSRPDAPAPDVLNDLMRRLYPSCRWTVDTATKIERADGSSFLWSEIMSRVRGKTVAQMADALKDLIPNPNDAGGG